MENKNFPIRWGRRLYIAFLVADVFFLLALIYNLYDLIANTIPAKGNLFLPLLFFFFFLFFFVIFLGITFASKYVLTQKGLSVRLGIFRWTISYRSMRTLLSYPNDEYFLNYESKGKGHTHQLLASGEHCRSLIQGLLHANPSVHYEVYLDDHENHE